MSINNHEECSLSELELFKRVSLQSNILNGKFEKIYPITKLQDSGPIEFLIENATDHFLDLKQSYFQGGEQRWFKSSSRCKSRFC